MYIVVIIAGQKCAVPIHKRPKTINIHTQMKTHYLNEQKTLLLRNITARKTKCGVTGVAIQSFVGNLHRVTYKDKPSLC